MSVVLPAADVQGGAQETTAQAILVAVDGVEGLLTGFATEATVTGIAAQMTTLNSTATGIAADVVKLKKWPYATHDYVSTSFATGTFTETVTYKTGGATGTTVGTVTTVYNDISRGLPAATTYSPAKVV